MINPYTSNVEYIFGCWHIRNVISIFWQLAFVSFNFLKQILSAVLDSTPFAFSIRLAAAASRKDHSHLEKWLTEKLTLYNDSFLEVICMICPNLSHIIDACFAVSVLTVEFQNF
jgi:hypothetical protein